MSFNTFHPFPRLAAELRVKIWAYNFPPPRIVEISWNSTCESWHCVAESRHPPCHTRLVNREANEEYLKSWHLLLGSKDCHPQRLEWFNPEIDTLYLGGPSTAGRDVETQDADPEREAEEDLGSFSPKARVRLRELDIAKRTRFLACEIREWHRATYEWGSAGKNGIKWQLETFDIFPALETFVIADYDYDWLTLEAGKLRVSGKVEFVKSTLLKLNDPGEMAPGMLNELDELRKERFKEGARMIPPASVMEVLRGGVLINLN